MKLDMIIIDDLLTDILALETIVTDAANELGCEIAVSRFTDPGSALRTVDPKKPENRIVFVDEMMPGLNGTELIPLLREKSSSEALFVLMSSQHGYMKDGYSVEAFDFICKPFVKEDILSVIKRAIKKFRSCRQGTFDFYSDKTEFKIEYADILYISVARNYAALVTPSRRYCFRATVKQLLEKLPGQFVQVSGNTIVNITRVTAISPKSVVLRKDNITLEVSKTYFNHVLEAFKNIN